MTHATETLSAAARPPERWTEKPTADARFYLAMVAISAAFIIIGFLPSFYLKPIIKAPPPLSMLTMTHGLVFTAWLGLFVTQATLVARNNLALHRQLGMMGALLFGAMITLGVSTAITAGRLGHIPPGAPPPLAFMALPLMAFTATTALIAPAIWLRRRSDWHKRLMVVALFTMTGPGTGRIAIPMGFAAHGHWISIVITELLLAVAIAWDLSTHKRVHPAYLYAAALLAVLHVALAWGFSSPDWLVFARAITAG
ncbi:MAG: hypothetical protein IV086_04725 [Hyphomonadaceae bacterium]|nr:hypothetical protein [Hyphomonadaceae bacterium]